MRRYMMSLMLLFAISNSLLAQESLFEDGILFKITGKNLTKPSYIMGCFHEVEGSYVHSFAGFDEAFNNVEALAEEGDIDSYYELEGVKGRIAQEDRVDSLVIDSTLYDKTLKSYIHVLDSAMKKCNMFPAYKTKHPHFNMELMKWYAKIYAMNEEYFQKAGTYDDYLQMDQYVSRLAKKHSKLFFALDSIEMRDNLSKEDFAQVSREIDELPIERQIYNLWNASKYFMQGYNTNKFMASLYKQGHGGLFVQRMYSNRSASDVNDVRARNARWMRMLPDIMAKQPTLIFVGAGHLFKRYFNDGECRGLISDLREAGYTVEKMNK